MKTEGKTAGDRIDFAGFDDWVEIFTGGPQRAMNGKTYHGDLLIDMAVKTFDPNFHEPPAVLGHPADDAPAYGWVEAVKAEAKDGVKRLYAKFKQVVPEFADQVKSGRFKKRSAAFYPDGRLRHVGWLGAMPPAVKGLADVSFTDAGKEISFEFTETHNKKEKAPMKFSEFMEALKFWKQAQADPDLEIPEFTAPVTRKPAAPAFSEADIEAAKTEAAKAAKAEAEKAVRAEFAEAETRRRKADAKARIAQVITAGIAAGTIAPAWKDMGMAQFMESLDAESAIEFAEGGDKKTGLDWFVGFLESLPKLVDFKEVATRGKDVKTGGAAQKLEALVTAKMKEDKTLAYGAAFAEVQREWPDLAMEYQQELQG
jgi:hypothetical protein